MKRLQSLEIIVTVAYYIMKIGDRDMNTSENSKNIIKISQDIYLKVVNFLYH